MLVNFNDAFHPENRWGNECLSNKNPCNDCDIFKAFEVVAAVGSIAERQYAELPEGCKACGKKAKWILDCLTKLKWYEDKDKNLQTKQANMGARRYKKERKK